MVAARFTLLALGAASLVAASPCPFGQMAESGKLSEEQSAKFYKVRSEGASAVEEMMSEADLVKRDEKHARQEQFYKRQLETRALPLGGGLLNGILQPFTGELQGVDIPVPQATGLAIIPDAAHPFKRPTGSDVRGMCPTLNTMANHGYINRNGITNFAQAANACQITLGFGYDTCVFLSALGLIAGGDLPTGIYSIGGADSRVPNTIGPALGISKHGVFEVDQSISRSDTYFGNQANFNLTRFNRWYDIAKANGGLFSFNTLNQERQISFTESRNTNPTFNAEVKHFAVTLAERVFIPRALPNGTHQTLADIQNIGPFYLNETFPKQWFRRATAYGLDAVGVDIVALYAMGPTPVGHNEGVDNFVPLGVDFSNLTPAEASCLLLDSVLDLVPGQISPVILENFDIVTAFFNGAIVPFFSDYNCDAKTYTNPGPSAGNTVAGKSTKCNYLVNGKYQC